MNGSRHELKLYFAYTSPYSYLAMQPAYDLELSHRVRVRFIPYGVNIRKVYGPLDRADADRRKVRYMYLDARRIAKQRGIVIYPPKKIFSARLAFYGGLFAAKNRQFRPYSNRVFERFWRQELDVESRAAIPRSLPRSVSTPANFFAMPTPTHAPSWMHVSPRPIATRSSACRPSSWMASRSGARTESSG